MIGWGYLYTGIFIQATMTKRKCLYKPHLHIWEFDFRKSIYPTKKKKNHNCLGGKLLMVRKKVMSVMGLDENQ